MNNKLFLAISNELSRYIDLLNAKKKQGSLHFPVSYLNQIARTLFPALKKSGFCTLPIPGKPHWDPEDEYFEEQREASRRGIKIERAYLFPLKSMYNNPIVQQQIELDKQAGIEIHLLYIGDCLRNNLLPFSGSLEFSLWDDDVALFPLFSKEKNVAMEFILSSRQEDIEFVKYKWHSIFQQSRNMKMIFELESELDLEEPMLITASVADFLAKAICEGNQVDEEDCCWYHSVWQYLRILDLVSTPTWHSNFYKTQLSLLAQDNRPISILISGTADYSVLAYVLWAFREYSDENLNIVTLDLCETPLFLCKWYGKHVNRTIETVASDILTYNSNNYFDVIISDAFLTRFPLDFRKKVLKKWYSLLNKNGKVVTTVRLGGNVTGIPRRGSEEKADQFAREIKSVGRYWSDFLPIRIDELSERGREYALKMTSYSAGSRQNIIELFRDFNFEVIHYEDNDVKGELESTKYLDLVCIKDHKLRGQIDG